MMWTNEFKDLNELRDFLINQLNYDASNGFTFVQIAIKTDLKKVVDLLGKPDTLNTESKQQQTILYTATVDHPTEGKRDHHKLDALFWFFNHEPLEIIRVHFDYYKTGEFVTPFNNFIKELFLSVIDKLGKPDKETLRQGNEEITYKRGKHKFLMWSNAEGLRFQIK